MNDRGRRDESAKKNRLIKPGRRLPGNAAGLSWPEPSRSAGKAVAGLRGLVRPPSLTTGSSKRPPISAEGQVLMFWPCSTSGPVFGARTIRSAFEDRSRRRCAITKRPWRPWQEPPGGGARRSYARFLPMSTEASSPRQDQDARVRRGGRGAKRRRGWPLDSERGRRARRASVSVPVLAPRDERVRATAPAGKPLRSVSAIRTGPDGRCSESMWPAEEGKPPAARFPSGGGDAPGGQRVGSWPSISSAQSVGVVEMRAIRARVSGLAGAGCGRRSPPRPVMGRPARRGSLQCQPSGARSVRRSGTPPVEPDRGRRIDPN